MVPIHSVHYLFMKKLYREFTICFIVYFTLIITGCSQESKAYHNLHGLEEQWDNNPDSVITQLITLEKTNYVPESIEEIGLYTLLQCRRIEYQGLYDYPDSLLTICRNHYKLNDRHKLLSCYYSGISSLCRNDFEQGIDWLLNARETAIEIDDFSWKNQIDDILGNITAIDSIQSPLIEDLSKGYRIHWETMIYKNIKREEKIYHLSYVLSFICFIIFLIFVIGLCLIYIYQKQALIKKEKKIQTLKNEIEEKVVDATHLEEIIVSQKHLIQNNKEETEKSNKAVIQEWQNKLSDLSIKMALLYHYSWKKFNLLNDLFFEKGHKENTRNSILKDLDGMLSNFHQRKSIDLIERDVNYYMSSLSERLRTQCTFLSTDEINFCLLLIAGLSPRAVCLFFNIKYKNFYTRKSRIIKAIRESECPNKEEFIYWMNL